MKRAEKVGERDGEEQAEEEVEEFMGVKLKRSVLVGKRGGPCTPPPTWTSVDPQTSLSAVTARQLGANLWEVLPHLHPLSKMSKPGAFSSSSRLRRHHHHHKHKELQIQPVLEEEEDQDECCGFPDQPGSTGSFNRKTVESLRRHHRSGDRSGRALEPVSPASFGSSMEVTSFNPGATPSSSLELKGRNHNSSYSLKTSTELLKVLNRIWTLEEQHTSNVSLVRALKTELDNSRVRIKDLIKEKQMDMQVIDDLTKQLVEGKLARKSMDQERIKSAMQSLREELEDERKLRKRSESLHHKLARELLDLKSSFSKAMGELERERRARMLLEGLCDEFAIGIRDYEQELRSMQYKTERDQACGRKHLDNLVLHMSEAWLDERVQMKLGEESGNKAAAAAAARKGMVVDKLSSEIDAFLRAREQSSTSRKADEFFSNERDIKAYQSNIRRRSLESYPLNESTSAPKNADDEDEESVESESNCFELSKAVNDFDGTTVITGTQKAGSHETKGGGGGSGMSRLQARFQQHMTRAALSNGKSQPTNSENPGKSRRFGGANHMAECLVRNNSSSVEGDRIHPEDALVDESHGRLMLAGPTSPVKKWESKIRLQDEVSESLSKRASFLAQAKTLKAELIKARTEGRQWVNDILIERPK